MDSFRSNNEKDFNNSSSSFGSCGTDYRFEKSIWKHFCGEYLWDAGAVRAGESGAFVYGAMSFIDKLANGVAYLIIELFNPSCE